MTKKIEGFFEQRKGRAKVKVTPDLLQAYEISIKEHSKIYPTGAGILLFGKNPQQ